MAQGDNLKPHGRHEDYRVTLLFKLKQQWLAKPRDFSTIHKLQKELDRYDQKRLKASMPKINGALV